MKAATIRSLPESVLILPWVNVFKYDIPHNKRKRIKSITFFYELGTTDIYFMRFYRNGNAGFWDVFGLSIGAKVQYL